MLIKKLYYKDYSKIKKLVSRNKLKIPKYLNWKKLWNNEKKDVGEGIFKEKILVGYHSYFKKKLKIKNKFFKILVSSSWVVEEKYRRNSIILLNRYFNKKSDFFLTTTANYNVSKIWKSFGAFEINDNSCRKIFFKILNTEKFIEIVLRKKKLKYFQFFIKFFSVFFNIYLKIFKKEEARKFNLNYKFQNFLCNEITNFNLLYEKNSKNAHEIRSKKDFQNYLGAISSNKKIYFMLIKKKSKLIGYSVLVKEKILNLNSYRMNLGQIRIFDNEIKNINEVFYKITLFAKKKNCAIVEFRNLNKKIVPNLNKKNYFLRHISNNPYLILARNKNYLIKKTIIDNWDTSYLDGDCML